MAAIITVDPDGKHQVRQDVDTIAKTQRVGHIVGLAAAAVTGTIPLIFAATVAGRLIGRIRDSGVTDGLIKRVQQKLHPGMSVLLIYAQSGPGRREQIEARLRHWQPELLRVTCPRRWSGRSGSNCSRRRTYEQ